LESYNLHYAEKGGNVANTEFKVKPHGELPDTQMIEFWRNGVFVAGIYPCEKGIHVVSKYLDGTEYQPGHPPSVIVHLSKEE